MKIAYVIDSLEGGGVALPAPLITRVLRNTGAHVEIFALTRRDGRALAPMISDGLDVHVRNGKGGVLGSYFWLDKQLKEYKPNLIWTSLTRATIIGLLLGKRKHIPVVCWQHNAYLKSFRRFLLWLLRKQPVMWVGDSDMVADLTAKRFDVPPERMACWPLFSADADASQATPWQLGQPIRLGSLGRLHRQKGYDLLIDALVLLKQRGFVSSVPFKISIAGEGRDRAKLVAKAKKIGFSGLQLVGFVEQPKQFLASLHLYIQPSRYEGFCISMHEAMQAGLTVIASKVGQMPYTVEAGSGWVVDSGDVPALADALADALSHPEKLAAMGQAAKARVYPRYSSEAFKDAGENILQRLNERGVV
jgi:glycosyltransferase involved in cell wall biosynthesis